MDLRWQVGFKESGLSLWCAQQLEGMGSLHPLFLVGGLCVMMTFLTELTSNTATAEMFLPVLAALSVAVGLNPLLLMIPATLSCSCAFMLPVATPPNAIVFGTDRIAMRDMARVGVGLNLIGAVMITAAIAVVGRVVLGIELGGDARLGAIRVGARVSADGRRWTQMKGETLGVGRADY